MLAHKESSKGRRYKDAKAEKLVRDEIVRLNIFSVEAQENATLQNVATKDQANLKVSNSLLNAKNLGQKQLESFVKERLIETSVSFRATLAKNKAPTFASLYTITQKSKDSEKSSIVKVDRNVMKRLITAYEAGRDVNLAEVLQHELIPVPVAIAELNGSLKSGKKANLGEVILKDTECPESVTLRSPSSIIFDGQALVQSLGKPNDARTFGDYADFFVRTVLYRGRNCSRIDNVFDRYRTLSIKAGTRTKRKGRHQPVRRKIENRDVPLQAKWSNFFWPCLRIRLT